MDRQCKFNVLSTTTHLHVTKITLFTRVLLRYILLRYYFLLGIPATQACQNRFGNDFRL